MKPASGACFKTLWRLLLAFLACLVCAGAQAQLVRPQQAEVLLSDSQDVPAASAPWQVVDLPYFTDRPVAWFRIRFDAPAPAPPPGRSTCPTLWAAGACC